MTLPDEFVYEPEKCTEVIDVDLPHEVIIAISMEAHRRDITFNHMINEIVFNYCKKVIAEESDRLAFEVCQNIIDWDADDGRQHLPRMKIVEKARKALGVEDECIGQTSSEEGDYSAEVASE